VQQASSSGVWGLPEAALGWFSAQIVAIFAFASVLVLGDWTSFQAERPGGHLGRAAGQVAAGLPLENNSVPLFWEMTTLFGLWIPLLAVPWLFAAALGHTRPGWRFEIERRDVGRGVLAGVLLQVPLIPLVYTLVQLLFGELEPSDRAFQLSDRADSWWKVAMLYAFVAVGAPVVEEFFYRGLVQPAIVRRLGPVAGIGISGLLFGAVHFSWIELPALWLVGIVFGWLAWSTGRLGPAIVGHITFNAFTLTVLLSASGSG
jgi:membrane protease YdiL (CAAX protease family)